MQLEAIGSLIKYRLKTGEEVTLQPGVPMSYLPSATQLLKKAPDKVRRVDSLPSVLPGARHHLVRRRRNADADQPRSIFLAVIYATGRPGHSVRCLAEAGRR